MPKKKKNPQSGPRLGPVPVPSPDVPSILVPRFAVGIPVRVKGGVRDPDFPDFPLDGWAGIVDKVDWTVRPPLYLVVWNPRTLDAIHPVYRLRCENEGLDQESTWLAEEQLELDTGDPVPIAQPGTLTPRPLQLDEEKDRVRAIFGLSSDEPLPPVNPETLHCYYEHLARHLRFPFPALCQVEPVIAVKLVPPEEASSDDNLLVVVAHDAETVGLMQRKGQQGGGTQGEPAPGYQEDVLPLEELEPARKTQEHQLLMDYRFWREMAPGRQEDAAAEYLPPMSPRVAVSSLLRLAFNFLVGGAAAGALVGAVLETVEGGRPGVLIGASVLALLGFLAGGRYGAIAGAVNRLRLGGPIGGVTGALIGALIGTVAGALVVAFVGTILGGIAGTLLGRMVRGLGFKKLGEVAWTLLGTWIGGLILAWYRGPDSFLSATMYGAAQGGLIVVVLVVSLVVMMAMLTARRK